MNKTYQNIKNLGKRTLVGALTVAALCGSLYYTYKNLPREIIETQQLEAIVVGKDNHPCGSAAIRSPCVIIKFTEPLKDIDKYSYAGVYPLSWLKSTDDNNNTEFHFRGDRALWNEASINDKIKCGVDVYNNNLKVINRYEILK